MDDVGVTPFRHVSKQVRHHSVALVRRFQLLVKVSCERLSCLRVQFLSLSLYLYIYMYTATTFKYTVWPALHIFI